ncbi:MAG: alkaline phosphatase family protein [Acidimicrobiia bacterium]
MTPNPVIPEYDERCVSRLVPSLLGFDDRSWLPEPARNPRTVVLFILDGFGWELYERHRSALPNIDGFVGDPITTVVPSTTAAVLTSIATGVAPAAHGILGFRMRMDDEILNTLRWTTDSGASAPDPLRVQRFTPFLQREVPVITQAEHERTAFTEAHLRGSRFCGWTSLPELVDLIVREAMNAGPLVYAYYPKIDSAVHDAGLDSDVLMAELARVDEAIGVLRRALPEDVAILISADHGGVHVGPDGWRDSLNFDGLVARQAGEGRFRYVFARDGAIDELAAVARAQYGDEAWVRTRDEAFAEGWFGPGDTPSTRRRVGDVIIAPFADVAYLDPGWTRERRLVGLHGSLTAAEMYVPCIAARGEASRAER